MHTCDDAVLAWQMGGMTEVGCMGNRSVMELQEVCQASSPLAGRETILTHILHLHTRHWGFGHSLLIVPHVYM